MKFDSPEALEEYIDSQRIEFYKVAVVDIDGVLRGKYMSRDKLSSALRKGFGFCDVVVGWDSQDQLYDNGQLSGWHTGYRDASVRLDLGTARLLPMEDDTLFLLGNLQGSYAEACSRTILSRVVKWAQDLGFSVEAALEYEFFVFDETPHSVREKGYKDLKPFTPGMFGYSVLRSSVHANLYQDLLKTMVALEVPIEGLHTETGPGVIEAALCHCPPLEAADRAALFKTFTKVFLQQNGLMGTFMSKWSDRYPGQSGHIHLSLERDGQNVFATPVAGEMSSTFRHFVAGQVALLPELLPMVCSTVNAYRRLVPGFWAPTHATWGIENRTTAVRAIPAGSASRSEYRIGPADANPYLAMAAALASGLYGIVHQLSCDEVVGNAYENASKGCAPLPSTLGEASRAFAASSIARELFGAPFVEHFAASRDWEDRQFRRSVSSWDLERYFEII
jgi:glutamine synthetase